MDNNLFIKIFIKVMTYFERYRIIQDRIEDEPYLERFYIFLRNRKYFPFNIFIHRFLKSDPDDLHDHPWAFASIILFGGYWEYTENEKNWRGPLSFRYASANTFHRIELDKNIPYCWTIFIPFMSTRDWGFKTTNGWINYQDYFKMKKLEKIK